MEILLGLLLLAIPFVLPIASWVRGSRQRDELASQSQLLKDQEEHIRRLTNRVAQLERAREVAPAARPIVTPPVAEAPPPVAPPPIARPQPQPPPLPAREVVPPPPLASPKPSEIPHGEGGPPPSSPPEPPEPPAPWLQLPAFDWESFVGVRLFSAIAGIALAIAGVFFLRYSIEHGWLQPTVRVVIGVLTGIGLLVVCEMRAARRYPITANALDAAAIAILFSTFFSAYALWKLIPAFAAFGLLALVTATAVLLSIRRESLFIAVLGLLGGFATPMLLSTGENNPIGLFSYLLLLNIGLAWVAYRQRWPVLTALSLVLTTLYQWGWVLTFLDAGQLPIATGIFVVFAIVGFAGLVLAGPRTRQDEVAGHFEKAGLLAAVMPMLFAVYFAAVPGYREHFWLLFTFLFMVDAGLLAIALARRVPLLHAVSAMLTLVVFGAWLASSYTHAAWPSVLGIASAFVLFYLVAPVAANRVGRTLVEYGAYAVYAAPALLYVFAVLVVLEDAIDAPAALFGVLFVVMAAIASRAVIAREGGLFFLGAFFVLVAEALWSARFLRTERLTEAVVLYAAFGFLYLAVPLVARRLGRALEPAFACGAVLIAGMALLFFLTTRSVAPQATWAFALLLTILNAALFIESGAVALPALSLAGSALSWLLLATWWYQAAGAVGVLPSLLILVVLTLLMLAGYAWNRRTEPPAESIEQPLFAHGLYLALVGDVFLAALASQPQWATPPWPLFGALFVITLALLVTALAFADGILHLAAFIAAAAVAISYVVNASVAPWPAIGVALFAAIAALALAWLLLAQRFRFGARAGEAAAAVIFIGMFGAMIAAERPASPHVWILTAFHAAASVAILLLTTRAAWPYVPVAASVAAGLAAGIWSSTHGVAAVWLQVLAFGGVLYGIFVAYPLMLGRRSTASRDPYFAAIVASAWFFFVARHAFVIGGYESIIGVVPVALGAAMALLLYQLLRLETPGQRDLGRLALVAGVGLAFITVAIPLQLREQWITIGWALEGAALAWLLTRIPHRGLLYGSVGLLVAVFIRLAMNPEIFDYPRSATPVFNWYLYTYGVAAAAMFASAWWLTRTDVEWASRASQGASAAGVILLFFLLNIEIADYHAQGQELVFRFGTTIAQDLTYTLGWLVFGLALLAAGITLRNRPARIAAVALIAVTTFKCFLYDLGSLEGLYRVAAFVGLAMSLTLVSLALQKFVLATPRQAT